MCNEPGSKLRSTARATAFAISSKEDRRSQGEGWTAYAPMEGFSVERDGDEYLVHFEVSVIK